MMPLKGGSGAPLTFVSTSSYNSASGIFPSSSPSPGTVSPSGQVHSKAVHHCCVPLCTGDSRYDKTLRFHRMPSDKNARKVWIAKIRRDPGKLFQVSRAHYIQDEVKFIIFSPIMQECVQDIFFQRNTSEKLPNAICYIK